MSTYQRVRGWLHVGGRRSGRGVWIRGQVSAGLVRWVRPRGQDPQPDLCGSGAVVPAEGPGSAARFGGAGAVGLGEGWDPRPVRLKEVGM